MTSLSGTGADTRVAWARFFRALGDPTRLAILENLLERPHTVSELIAKLGVPQSRASNHLACLSWCQFVTGEKRGRNVVYSVTDPRLRELLDMVAELSNDKLDHLVSCSRIGPDWV